MGSNVVKGSKRGRTATASAEANGETLPVAEETPLRASVPARIDRKAPVVPQDAIARVPLIDPTSEDEVSSGGNVGDSRTMPRPAVTGLLPQAHGGALAPQWPPGVSGNPGGRAKTPRISDYVATCLGMTVSQLVGKPARDEPAGMVAARAWVLAGCGGDVRALETLADRAEGKPTQRVEVDTNVKAYDVTMDVDNV